MNRHLDCRLVFWPLVLLACGPAAATILPPEDTSNLYVSSYGTDEVHCYAADGRFLFKFGHDDLSGPRGLAFGVGQELHVASEKTDRILVFSEGGAYLRQFTDRKSTRLNSSH